MTSAAVKVEAEKRAAPTLESPEPTLEQTAEPQLARAGMPRFLLAQQDDPHAPRIQAKRAVSQAGDPLEEEADWVADHVVRDDSNPGALSVAGSRSVQRKCATCEAGGSACPECEEEEDKKGLVQRQAAPSSAASINPEPVLETLGGDEGVPLGGPVRADLERGFGYQFAGVRIHAGDRAAHAARGLNALAFTIGQDIYFGSQQFQPETAAGRRLLAHELTHTIQQTPFSNRASESAPADGEHSGGAAGNRVIASPAANATVQRTEADANEARRLATEIYGALDGINDAPRALNALRGHDSARREAIATAFAADHGSLEDYLVDQLDDDDRVNALRLLHAPEENDDCGFMGRALVAGWTVRDEEPGRILYSRPTPTSRQQLAAQYDESFARLGKGTLEGDIKDRMSGWRREKALVLLNRNLTDADEIYFDSVAITGTHDEAVVNRVESVWGRGVTAYETLVDDWRRFVKNEDHWTDPAFTSMTFMEAMIDELDGEHLAMVRAIDQGAAELADLDAAQRLQHEGEGGLPMTTELTEDEVVAREDVRLRIANGILDAAAEGLGTNEAQLFHAVEEIQKIWKERLDRAERLHNDTLLADYRRRWEAEREKLQAAIADEMEEGSTDYMKARLLLEGALTRADEIHLAHEDGDYDKVLALATQAWADDTIDSLKTECARAREAPRIGRAAGSDETVVIRPAFTLIIAVPVSHGDQGARLYPLLNEGTQVSRGIARLAHDLAEGDSDSDLQNAYQFITTPGLPPGVRDEVIAGFVGGHESEMPVVAASPGEAAPSANRRFVQYVMQRYDKSHAAFRVQNLLDPSSDFTELANRAEERMAAERRGIFAQDIEDWTTTIDAITGNDTTQATEESARRLRWLATNKENTALMGEVQGAAGVDTDQALAEHEFGLYSQRFEDWSALRREIVETFATLVEIAVDLAIVAATGGGAAPLLLASLASTVVGIAVREAALGSNYDAVSRENAQRLLTAAVAAVAGAAAHEVVGAAVDLQKLSRLQAFGVRAITDAAGQVGAQTVQLGFLNHFPTDEEIGAAALTIVGSALVAGTLGAATHADPNVVTSVSQRVRTKAATGAAHGFMTGVISEGAGFLSGNQDLSGGEMVGKMASRGTRDGAHGLVTALRDAYTDERTPRAPQFEEDEPHGAGRRRPPTGDEAVDAARRPRARPGDEEIPDPRLAPPEEALLARTRRGKPDLSTMESELEIAQRLPRRPSTDPDYDEEIELPNGHKWRRRRGGGWCRFSGGDGCIIDPHGAHWRGLSESERAELNRLTRRGHVSIEDLDTFAISRAPDVPWSEVVALLRRLPPGDVERFAALLHDQDLPLNRTDLDRLHIALDAGGPVRPLIEELYNLRPAVHAETVMPVDEPPPETSGTPVPAPRRLGPRALDQLRRMAVEDWGLRGEELEKFMRKARTDPEGIWRDVAPRDNLRTLEGSAALRANMLAEGELDPPKGYHAHHIVPEKEFGEGLDWLRTRLEDAGASINSRANGVFLAGSRSTANPELTQLHNSYIHAGKQVEYAYTLTVRLGHLEGGALLAEIAKIKSEMATGHFKTIDIPHGWKGKWKPGMAAVDPSIQRGAVPTMIEK